MPAVILLFLSLISAPAMADDHADAACQKPAAAGPVPDGSEATREEMLNAKDAIEKFVGRGETYLDCMSGKIDSMRAEIQAQMAAVEDAGQEAGAKVPAEAEEEYRQLVQAHDAVVAEMQRLAEAFNQALTDYNDG